MPIEVVLAVTLPKDGGALEPNDTVVAFEPDYYREKLLCFVATEGDPAQAVRDWAATYEPIRVTTTPDRPFSNHAHTLTQRAASRRAADSVVATWPETALTAEGLEKAQPGVVRDWVLVHPDGVEAPRSVARSVL